MKNSKYHLMDIKRSIIFVLITLFLFFLLFFNIHYILQSKVIDKTLIGLGFSLKSTEIKGLKNFDEENIKKSIAFYNCANLFCINLKKTKVLLEQKAWIKSAHLYFNLPNTLKIFLEEETPTFIYAHKDTLNLINDEGKLITKIKNVEEKFQTLIILEGENANKKIKELNLILKESPKLANKITKASLVSERRWSLTYLSKIILDLPENNPHQAFNKIYEVDLKYGLLSNNLAKIDLRTKERMIIEIRMNENLVKESKNEY